MSRSQFHSKIFILRHAWLNLWDERMTTGRINQVAFTYPRQIAQNRSKSKSRQCRHNPGTKVPGREAEPALCQIPFPVNYQEDHHKNAAINIIQSPQRSVLPTAKAGPNESVAWQQTAQPWCWNVSYLTGQRGYNQCTLFSPVSDNCIEHTASAQRINKPVDPLRRQRTRPLTATETLHW